MYYIVDKRTNEIAIKKAFETYRDALQFCVKEIGNEGRQKPWQEQFMILEDDTYLFTDPLYFPNPSDIIDVKGEQKMTEEQNKRQKKLQNESTKRYFEKHNLITFGTKIEKKRYEKIAKALKDKNVSIKQLIDKAIDEFLKGNLKINSKTKPQGQKEKIVELIKRNKDLTINEISRLLGINSGTTWQYITRLKKDGKIERVGGKTGGYWEIKDETEKSDVSE